MAEKLPAAPEETPSEIQVSDPLHLAIVGRPNAGKSSLLNKIVGYERAIVSEQPGTTRDPLDTTFQRNGKAYVIVDTAGIRRRPRVTGYLEKASVVRALRVLERAEVAVLVIDATEGATDQDLRIAGYASERGRGLVIALNKWDIVSGELRNRGDYLKELHYEYPNLRTTPDGLSVRADWPTSRRNLCCGRRSCNGTPHSFQDSRTQRGSSKEQCKLTQLP